LEQVDRQAASDLQRAAVYTAAGGKVDGVLSFTEARAAFDERLSADPTATKRDPLLEVLGL